MSDTDLGNLDAGKLEQLYRTGEASPLEATRAALDRIDRFNDAVNAYVHVDREGAEKAAKASARRWGQGKPLSAIDGIPVSMKDLAEVAGMPARGGSLTTSESLCEEDCPPARMLREAGAVILGKTNTPEFGWKAVTDNRVFGASYNPWDTRLTPGGSSGGAAAAAALNMGVLHQGGRLRRLDPHSRRVHRRLRLQAHLRLDPAMAAGDRTFALSYRPVDSQRRRRGAHAQRDRALRLS